MNTERLIAYIKTHYEVHTIILYGSFARGDHDVESDIDVVAFGDNVAESQDKSLLDGRQLDLWIYPREKMEMPSEFIHITGGQVLLDEAVLAQSFLESIHKFIEAGLQPKSETAIKSSLDWLEKMNRRASKSDLEGAYRKHWLLTEILPIYFEIKNEWYFGSKAGFYHLKNFDMKGYELFERMYSEPNFEHIEAVIYYLRTMTPSGRSIKDA